MCAGMDHPVDPLTGLPHEERIRSRKLAGGVATIIVDASGLSAAEAKRVEDEVRAGALQVTGVGHALAWRGPMATGALANLVDADWGNTELLLVDLPPGTGDVQLSLIQRSRPAGAIIVSTPQDLSLIDARRAVDLFNKTSVPVLGIIENMATYECPHCGEESHPFGSGGAEAAAAELGVPFLGRLPLSLNIREASDAGTPPAASDGT